MIPEEIPEQAIDEPENPTLIEDLTDDQCKFPKWDKPNEPHFCCGRKKWKVPRKRSLYYCEYHVYITTKSDKLLDIPNKL